VCSQMHLVRHPAAQNDTEVGEQHVPVISKVELKSSSIVSGKRSNAPPHVLIRDVRIVK